MDRRDQRLLSAKKCFRLKAAGAFRFAVPLCFILVLLGSASVDGKDRLTHMGLAYLNDSQLAGRFAQRLLAEGKPVFYIRNVSRGVSQGDIIRFRDKAVLIDGDIWQTMKSMGVLSRLRNIPIMTLTAGSKSRVWASRSDQVSGSKENKGYTLGRELLKIFEDYFGKTPSHSEIVVKFSGSHMTLVAPEQLMNELRFVNVVRVEKNREKPSFITKESPSRTFTGHSFSWKIWAVDPLEPSGQLKYGCSSSLPPGLSWNKSSHTLSGTPEEAGAWPLRFTARNSRGQSATFLCTLEIKKNTPPRIQAKFEDLVFGGTHLQITPCITDAEHLPDEIEVKLFRHPQGMEIDQKTKKIQWQIPELLKDTSVTFALAARDPLGAVARKKISFRILSPANAHKAMSVDFRLPVDTLVQGHEYRWADRVWKKTEWHKRNVKLESVEGTNLTRYEEGEREGILHVRPMKSGLHHITFTFLHDTIRVPVTKTLTVLPNSPPVFRSRLTTDLYDVNQNAVYVPIVTDKDGDTLELKVIDQSGVKREITGDEVKLDTEKPGLHTLVLVASDPFGNSVRQQIYYEVRSPQKYAESSFFLQSTDRFSTDFGFQSPGMRLGFHSADIFKTLQTGVLGLNTFQSPFLFVGGNPLGEKQYAKGNYLFVDCGISARVHDEKLYSGGVVGRLQTNYRKGERSSWRFQGVFTVRLKQALFVTDTSGLGEELSGYADRFLLSGGSDLPPIVEKLASIFGAYGQTDNFGFFLQLQTLYRFPYGVWLGPSIWMQEDIKMPDPESEFEDDDARFNAYGNVLLQYTGVCVLHDFELAGVELSQQIHLGWRGDSWAPKAKWSFLLKY
ncbi:MAG: putative Ig domain-containing protein [Chitinispirillaceae bacterium]